MHSNNRCSNQRVWLEKSIVHNHFRNSVCNKHRRDRNENVDAVNLKNPQQIISALRNKKAFSYYLPFRTKQAYRKEITHSSMEKLILNSLKEGR
jgi:hypothetical protein